MLEFKLTPAQEAWRDEVRAFLREEFTSELKQELWVNLHNVVGLLKQAWYKKLREKGWWALSWPKEYGGKEMSPMDQYILTEEFYFAGAPTPTSSVNMVGPTIIRYGTEENKKMWLPMIASGEMETCLGYSEANAGTDLASLSTRAELVGDEWVINGTKMWITNAQSANYMWLACRTDTVAKHKGISVIVVPIPSPGLSLRHIACWNDAHPCEVVLEDVRVPKNYLIGEVNKGWTYITAALDFERVFIGVSGELRKLFSEMVCLCNNMVLDGMVLAKRSSVRRKIAELARDLEVVRLLGYYIASRLEAGLVPSAEASTVKVLQTELRAKMTSFGMQITGLYGQLNREDPDAPLKGEFEYLYRYAPMLRFGGGANEVQRDIIALRGLGMPRK